MYVYYTSYTYISVLRVCPGVYMTNTFVMRLGK